MVLHSKSESGEEGITDVRIFKACVRNGRIPAIHITNPPSLMPQRFNRIELCRTPCGDVAEDDADGGGEGEGEQVDAGAEQEGQRQQVGQAVAGDEGEQ